jgi:hypothetical protein
MKGGGRVILIPILLFFAAALTACVQTQEMADMQRQIDEKENEIRKLEASNKEQETAIEQYRSRLGEPSGPAPQATMTGADSPLLYPNAKPGECYARVYVPPTYETTTEQQLKQAASEKLEIIPAQYEWVEQKILTKEASTRMEVIPAEYEWVEEKVLVKEATFQLEEIPATYEWVEEQVLVKPAHTVWKKGRGPIEKVDNLTGEIMCLVEVPATYKTVRKKVMTSPPSTRRIEIPAEYKTYKKQVMVKPPTERIIEIPADYETVKVRQQVSPAQERKIEFPEEYQTVEKTTLVKEGHLEWRRILCETNLTPEAIRRIQSALINAGYDPGPPDGEIGWHTMAAIKSFQRDNNLAEGGITYETIDKLNVKL